MRVCFLSHQSNFIYGGEKVTIALAKGLSGDYEPEFAMPDGPYAEAAKEVAPVQLIPSMEFSRNIWILWSFLASWVSTNETLRTLSRGRNYGLIHATSLKSMVYAWMLGYKQCVPIIWHHHDIMPVKFSNQLWLKAIALGATKIIVVSQAAKDAMTLAGVPGQKILVIRNGLNPEDWPCQLPKGSDAKALHMEAEKLHIGYVGELSPRKGLDWLPEIFKALDEDYGDSYRCTIVGEAQSDIEFGHRIRRELQPWVDKGILKFVGRQENVSEWMQRFEVLLVPSRQDPYPTVIMEANFSGTPVLARPRGGVPEMITDGESGHLCPEIEDFIRHLKVYIDDRKELCAIAARARKFAENNFSITKMAKDFTSVYEGLKG